MTPFDTHVLFEEIDESQIFNLYIYDLSLLFLSTSIILTQRIDEHYIGIFHFLELKCGFYVVCHT